MSAAEGRWLDGLMTMECVFPSPPTGDWHGAPGRVLRGPDGAAALNFAPGRWLLLTNADHWSATATAAGALLFDTDGKWRVLRLPRAHRALHAALDLDSTLEHRDCAAASMFDTPVVIARASEPDLLLLCIPASYAASFSDSVQAWR